MDVQYEDADQRIGGNDTRCECHMAACTCGPPYADQLHTFRVTITETVQTIYETRAYSESEAEARAVSTHLGPFEAAAAKRETHVLERTINASRVNQ